MARSTYVYTVLYDMGDNFTGPSLEPTAAFTVKRELVGWLIRQTAYDPRRLRVFRMHDGWTDKEPVELDVEELLHG